MWNNKPAPTGRKNYNEKRVTANPGAMVMKREFHTWELDDDQSVVSKKEEKKEESKIDPNLPNAKNLILQGLPKDVDLSSESEDDEDKKTKSQKSTKSLSTVEEKEGNSDDDENVPPSQQKTLVPMLSEEEIEERERAFITKLKQVKSFLHTSVFAFAERMRESSDPQPAQPVYAPPSPDKKVVIAAKDSRGEKLSAALDEVLEERQGTSTMPSQEKSGMKLAEDVSVTLQHVNPATSLAPVIDKTKEEIAEEVAEQLRKVLEREEPKRSMGMGIATKKPVSELPPHPSILPPAVTEIEGGMSLLNVKLTNKKDREFDWTRQQSNHAAQPDSEPSFMSTSLPAADLPPASVITPSNPIPPLDIPLFYPSVQSQLHSSTPVFPAEGVKGIGFDPRVNNPTHVMLTESSPPSPLSMPSPSPRSESSITPRGHGVKATAPQSLSLSVSPASSVSSLRSFALPPAALNRMQAAARKGTTATAGNDVNPTFTAMLETKILTLSAKATPNPLVKSLSHHAISDSLGGSSGLKREASMQSM